MQELAAKYLQSEASRASLISITKTEISSDMKHVTFFISVFPSTEESRALDFARRKRTQVREYIDKNAKVPRLPIVDFELDIGEKNRKRVDELLAEDKNR